MKPSSTKVGLTVILIAGVCAVVLITYWPSLDAKAFSFDDQQYLTRNILVQNPGLGSAKRFLTEVLTPSTVAGYYQPLAMISLMVDYAAGGRENNLRPFHITSLAFHTANTVLVILLLYMLFGNIWAAAGAGLLFGVHPMTVEPIPWVGERKTLLAAFFALWSLILYVRYSRSGGWKAYAGCFAMYLLALMSKPTSVPLPAVMVLMDYWPLKRLSVKSLWEKLPLFVLGGLFAVITYISQHRTGGTVAPTQYGPWHILLVLCHNIVLYLYKIFYKMILPVNLSSHYAFPKPFDFSQPMVLAGVIGTCILIPLLLVSLRWTRAALTGWLIFFVAIFPTMGVVGFTVVIAADRFVYLPAVGLLMVLTAFLIWFGRSKRIRIAVIGVVLVLASAEAVATGRYLYYWQDTFTLYDYMLRFAPHSAPLYNGRGVAYNRKGEYDLAIADYDRAIEIDPEFAGAYSNRGNVYDSQGKYDLAISDYNRAIELNPRYAAVYNNRGTAYHHKGEYGLAISDYKKTIEINSTLVGVYFNMASAFESLARKKEAIEAYKAFIKYAPSQHASYIERARQRIKELER